MKETRFDEFGIEIEGENEGDGELGVIQDFPNESDAGREVEEENNPVEVLRIPSQADLPTIGGHELKPAEWLAFEKFALTSNLELAAQAANVSKWTIWRWRKLGWWKKLHKDHVSVHQEAFEAKLASFSDELLEGLRDVATGKDKNDHTASARVRAAEIFMRSGTEPIIKQKPVVEINTGARINNLQVDGKGLEGLTKAQLNEYARTGELPERVVKIIEAEEG